MGVMHHPTPDRTYIRNEEACTRSAKENATMTQRTIDAHNHWYPKEYLDYLCSRQQDPIMRHDGGTHYRAYVRDVCIAHIDRAGHYDLDARIKDLDAAGLDTEILSVTIPGPETVGGKEGVEWATRLNDSLAQAEKDYPHRFYWLGHPALARRGRRLRRTRAQRRRWVARATSSSPTSPASRCGWRSSIPSTKSPTSTSLPCLIHPADPLTASVMDKVRIPYQLWGYTLDTSMAIVSLILQGVLDKYPEPHVRPRPPRRHGSLLRPQAAGLLQGLRRRVGHRAEQEPGPHLQDSASGRTPRPSTCPAMKCCLEWVGPEHMGIGTDYAHRVGDPEGAIKAVRDLQTQAGLTEDQVNMILGKNFEKLFKLPKMPGRD